MITTAIPAAYLGLAPAFLPERVARICANCQDKSEAEAMALADDCALTHGMCESCFASEMARIEKLLSVRKQ